MRKASSNRILNVFALTWLKLALYDSDNSLDETDFCFDHLEHPLTRINQDSNATIFNRCTELGLFMRSPNENIIFSKKYTNLTAHYHNCRKFDKRLVELAVVGIL
jgi:hypothetical protein